jgi:segregation and condensation protein A
MQGYNIKINQFEGPFDLLLFFIERDELNIYDIPIAKITQDFLDYIRELEQLNLDVASEFILMAATLIRIKARSLIPRKQIDEEGNEIDPRKELVQRLLEYKRYKEIIAELLAMEDERKKKHARTNVASELKIIANKALVDIELESLTLFKLLKAYDNVMNKYEDRKNRTYHEIVKFPYTIQDQQTFIKNRVKRGERNKFEHIFGVVENRIEAIVTFLALLELLNTQVLTLMQGEGHNNFWISYKETAA